MLGMRKLNAALMLILRKQAYARLLHTIKKEFLIWTANCQEAAKRVIREDNLVIIKELVSDLMDKSYTQPDISFVMSTVSKKPAKDKQPKSDTEESKELSRCLYCNGKHPGDKERCFYLHLEL